MEKNSAHSKNVKEVCAATGVTRMWVGDEEGMWA